MSVLNIGSCRNCCFCGCLSRCCCRSCNHHISPNLLQFPKIWLNFPRFVWKRQQEPKKKKYRCWSHYAALRTLPCVLYTWCVSSHLWETSAHCIFLGAIGVGCRWVYVFVEKNFAYVYLSLIVQHCCRRRCRWPLLSSSSVSTVSPVWRVNDIHTTCNAWVWPVFILPAVAATALSPLHNIRVFAVAFSFHFLVDLHPLHRLRRRLLILHIILSFKQVKNPVYFFFFHYFRIFDWNSLAVWYTSRSISLSLAFVLFWRCIECSF